MLLFLIVTAALTIAAVAYAAVLPSTTARPEFAARETLVSDERGVNAGS